MESRGSRRARGGLSYANVVATIALVVAVGTGGAYAANQIGPKDIKKNAVRAKHIKKNQVKAKHVVRRSIGQAKLRNGAVATAKLRDGAVSAAKLGDGAVATAKLQDGAVTAAKLAAGIPGLAPIAAFEARRDGVAPPPLPANTETTIVTLPVPAGSFVINAKVDFDEISVGEKVHTCFLRAGTRFDRSLVSVEGGGGQLTHCTNQLVHEFESPGEIKLAIATQAASQLRAGWAAVTAVKVEEATSIDVTG